MKNLFQPLALAAFALWLGGCASSSIKQNWKSPAYQGGPVQKVAVLAVDERGIVREGLENRFVREMREHGQGSMATYNLLRLADVKADKEAAAARLRADGADAILIIRMVDQATYSREATTLPGLYPAGVTTYGGYGWYDFYSLAFGGLGVVNSSVERRIYIDSSFFELKTGQRLGAVLTQTVLKEDADALVVADALAAKVVKALGKDGLVRE
jgi:hypothetical protein